MTKSTLVALVIAAASALAGGFVALVVQNQIEYSMTPSLYQNPLETRVQSVEKFGPLKVGWKSPDRPGDWALAPDYTIPHSQFYIFALQKELGVGCTYEDCGMSGVLVECLGGWLSGSEDWVHAEQYGMDVEEVKKGNASLIVVADIRSNIVGIYPDSTTHNIPRILKKHPELYDSETMQWCSEYHMPR